MSITIGSLTFDSYDPDLVAAPVADLLAARPDLALLARTVAIDPDLADTAALTEAFGLAPEVSANCIVVLGKRGGEERTAACVVLADSRADVNNVARRAIDVRKVSFAPQERAVTEAGMEHGGITPVGLPEGWTILVDSRVVEQDHVIVGSGLRRSKLALPGAALAELPGAQVIEGLGRVPGRVNG